MCRLTATKVVCYVRHLPVAYERLAALFGVNKLGWSLLSPSGRNNHYLSPVRRSAGRLARQLQPTRNQKRYEGVYRRYSTE
ncbi:MAG: hypothetical protein IKC89_05565 [Lentisphaeria bacterium]|nr:hypothetical protein [Lentisphaeria bacterium]